MVSSQSFVVAVCLLALSGCPRPNGPAPSGPDAQQIAADVEAIKAQSRSLSAAYVREDIAGVVDVYTAEGIAAPGGSDFVRGRAALLELWALPEGRDILRHEATPLAIEIDGDHAYDWGYYEGAASQAGEPPREFEGTYVIVWERSEDGRWRIAIDMWHRLPKDGA